DKPVLLEAILNPEKTVKKTKSKNDTDLDVPSFVSDVTENNKNKQQLKVVFAKNSKSSISDKTKSEVINLVQRIFSDTKFEKMFINFDPEFGLPESWAFKSIFGEEFNESK
ncbi:hypothetical protein V6O07_17320, partial [Arthrospira platensis SPKY2]